MSTRGSSGGGWRIAVVAVAAAVCAAWAVSRRAVEGPDHYPELSDVSGSLRREIEAALPKSRGLFLHSPPDGGPPQAVLDVLDRDPGRAVLALLSVLHSRLGAPSGVSESGSPEDDPLYEWDACWIRSHATPVADAVLERLAKDRGVHVELRQKAIVALCRAGNEASAVPLVDLALDPGENTNLRCYVLRRLSRLGGRPPAALRELLSVPFGGIDCTAAVALAEWGDFGAPTLLAEGLQRFAWESRRAASCAQALRRVVGDDPNLGPRLAAAVELGDPMHWVGRTVTSTDDIHRAERKEFTALAAVLREWLDRHPEACDTEFERERLAYLRSDRRERELSYTTHDVVLAAKDEDIDLAAALIVPGVDPAQAGGDLEQLDRLARLVRRDAGPSPTPGQWIDAMNRRLLAGYRTMPERESELSSVLWSGFGNCMGLSSLYLAVGERLGLPLFGVKAPRHVFVRWDDGVLRRNIEATERGAEHDDRWYATRPDGLSIRDEDVRSGAYLRNLTRHEFLALVCVNRCDELIGLDRPDIASRYADLAVRFDPRSASTLVCRGVRRAESDQVDIARAVEDVRSAESLCALTAREAAGVAGIYLVGGLPADALRVAEAGLLQDPRSVQLGSVRVRALTALRRFDEARSSLRGFAPGIHGTPLVDQAEIELEAAAGGDWFSALAGRDANPVPKPELHLVLARSFLDGTTRPASPQDAARVLDRIAGLDMYEPSEPSPFNNFNAWVEAKRHDHVRDRRRYYDLRIRCCRALGDEAGAARFEEARQALSSR